MMPVNSINDASLWNLSTQNGVKPLFSSDKTPEEYYEFQITKTMEPDARAIMNSGKIINMNKYKCHICNVEVPKAYSVDHINSDKHKTNKIIADTALERTKDQLNLELINANVNIHITNSYFCEYCVTVVMNTERNVHDVSSHHIASVKHDKMLKEFAAKYVEGSSVYDRDLTIIRNDNISPIVEPLFTHGFATKNDTVNGIVNFDSHVNMKETGEVNGSNETVNDDIQKSDNDSETSQKENDLSQCNRIKPLRGEQNMPSTKNNKKNKNIQGIVKRSPPKEALLINNIKRDTIQYIKKLAQREQNLESNDDDTTLHSTHEPIENKAELTDAKPKIESNTQPDIIPHASKKTGVPCSQHSVENTHVQIPKHADVDKKHVQVAKKAGKKTSDPKVDTKVVVDVPKKANDKTKTLKDTKQPPVEVKNKQKVPINTNIDNNTEQVILKLINETKTVQDSRKNVEIDNKEVPEKVCTQPKNVQGVPKPSYFEITEPHLAEQETKHKAGKNMAKKVDVKEKNVKDVKKTSNVETKTAIDDTKANNDNVEEQVAKQPNVETKTVKSEPKNAIQELKTNKDTKHVDVKTFIADTAAEILTRLKNEKVLQNIAQYNGDDKDESIPKVTENESQKNISQQHVETAQIPSTSNTNNANIKESVQQNAKKEIKEQQNPEAKTDNISKQNKPTTVQNAQQIDIQVPTTSQNTNQPESLKKKAKLANEAKSQEANNQMFRQHGSRKKRGKRRQTVGDIKEYIQYAKTRRDAQFDIEVISDRNLIITTVNSDTVKVSLYHFHGTDKRGIYCKVCQLHNIRDIFHHQQGTTHLDKIMKPLQNKHCIRMLDDTWSHCVICNMTYVSRHNESHVLSLAHIHNLRTSIVAEVNNNQPTPCPGQRRQYCNICRSYIGDLKTHVSEAHKMTLEERNKIIENSTDTAKVIQQNHLRIILNERLQCGICDVKIPKLDLIEHVVSSAHKEKYIEVLNRNNMNEIDCDTYYCIPCDDCVAVKLFTRHLSSRKHRKMLITQHFDMDQIRPLHPIQEQTVDSEKEDSKATEEEQKEVAEALAPINEDIEDVLDPTDAKVEVIEVLDAVECEKETVELPMGIEAKPIEIEDCEIIDKAEVPAPIVELNKLIGLKMYDSNATPIDPNIKPGDDPICEECNVEITDCDYASHLYSVDHITNHSCYLRYNHCVEVNFATVNCLACNVVFEIRYLVTHCNSGDHTDKLLRQIGGVADLVKREVASQTVETREVLLETDVGNTNEIVMPSQSPVPQTNRKGHEFIPKKLFYQFYEVCRTDGLKCIICYGGAAVPGRKSDVINHVNTAAHRRNYDSLMSFNRIRRLDMKHAYFCDLCAIPVPYFKELSHIHSSKHMELVTPLFNEDIPRSRAELTFDFAMQQQIRKQRRPALLRQT